MKNTTMTTTEAVIIVPRIDPIMSPAICKIESLICMLYIVPIKCIVACGVVLGASLV